MRRSTGLNQNQKQSEPRFTKREKLSLLMLSVAIQVYGMIILGLNLICEGQASLLLLGLWGFLNVVLSWYLIKVESGFLDG